MFSKDSRLLHKKHHIKPLITSPIIHLESTDYSLFVLPTLHFYRINIFIYNFRHCVGFSSSSDDPDASSVK